VPRILIGLLILSTLLFSAGCDREVGLGVVDLEQVLEEAPRALDLQEQLDQAGREMEEKYGVNEENISNEERYSRQEQAYKEYQSIKKELEKRFNQEVEKAVQEIAEEENLDVVFYKEAVSFGGKDITEQVVGKLQ